MEDPAVLAEEWKDKGNKAYSSKDYTLAEAYYTKAINLNPSVAAFYSNRAAAYLMRLNYPAAASDATKATSLDNNFLKGKPLPYLPILPWGGATK
jgi:serine/threonine-protein phosphatase 5